MQGFSAAIQNFASLFTHLQNERLDADYDPSATFFKSDVETRIKAARLAVRQFEKEKISNRRIFAVHLLFRERP